MHYFTRMCGAVYVEVQLSISRWSFHCWWFHCPHTSKLPVSFLLPHFCPWAAYEMALQFVYCGQEFSSIQCYFCYSKLHILPHTPLFLKQLSSILYHHESLLTHLCYLHLVLSLHSQLLTTVIQFLCKFLQLLHTESVVISHENGGWCILRRYPAFPNAIWIISNHLIWPWTLVSLPVT